MLENIVTKTDINLCSKNVPYFFSNLLPIWMDQRAAPKNMKIVHHWFTMLPPAFVLFLRILLHKSLVWSHRVLHYVLPAEILPGSWVERPDLTFPKIIPIIFTCLRARGPLPYLFDLNNRTSLTSVIYYPFLWHKVAVVVPRLICFIEKYFIFYMLNWSLELHKETFMDCMHIKDHHCPQKVLFIQKICWCCWLPYVNCVSNSNCIDFSLPILRFSSCLYQHICISMTSYIWPQCVEETVCLLWLYLWIFVDSLI